MHLYGMEEIAYGRLMQQQCFVEILRIVRRLPYIQIVKLNWLLYIYEVTPKSLPFIL